MEAPAMAGPKAGVCDRLLGSGHEQTANHYLISILVHIADSLPA